MATKADELMRQQYLIARSSVKKLRAMSRKEGVSAGELARRAIDAYTKGRVVSESDEETAALAALADIHKEVRAIVKRIDASLEEVRVRERALRDGSFRARVREETEAWIKSHPEAAVAIGELFAGDAA